MSMIGWLTNAPVVLAILLKVEVAVPTADEEVVDDQGVVGVVLQVAPGGDGTHATPDPHLHHLRQVGLVGVVLVRHLQAWGETGHKKVRL